MSFSPSSFFIGMGSVLLTIGVGFGGAVLMTDLLVGKQDREPSKLEQRAADKPVRPIVADVALVSEAKAAEVPRRAAAPEIQPASQSQPAVQDSYAKAHEADIRKEQLRQEQIKRREQRIAAERKRRKQEQRAIARARQEGQRREDTERQASERAAPSPVFAPFNFDD